MNKYELMVIVDSALSQDEKDSIVNEAKEIVSKSEGKVINAQVWLEKHKFTFPIRKKFEGTYYLINFEAKGAALIRIRQLIKLNERALRSMIVKVEE